MKSNTYELHNYAADLNDMDMPEAKDSRKRKTASARSGEKYSLRQKRQKRNAIEEVDSGHLPDFQLELDPIVEPASKSRKNTPTKAKTKAPPLSKYRRKTANARERTRMREINTAFETLRHCVPQAITGEDAANASEKLTKITTLRLAMKYITMLSDSIQDPSYESEFIGECLEESANREARVDSDLAEEAEVEVEAPLIAPAAVKKPAKTKGKKSSAASKRQTQKLAKSVPQITPISSGESCYATSSIGSPASSAYASLSSSSNSHSSSSSPGLEVDSLVGLHGISDLDTLLLEASDGDSLTCLSPGYESLLTGSGESLLPGCRGDIPMSALEKSDVELSLRLLDQRSADSFDFGSDQQPSACISSLASLEGYPFSDLLQSDFPDMFLT
ncbi:helix-loop-helix protein delilah [Drosophila kikkawai]|uniref:Helix-loop-helix protein delilah n=1 Tax=Drosophila kikkawai TaxID=30033 RepID=A0ABM4GIU4_DROKI|nr:helix-loop-helix protein delilah [Drosophila kikkawai]